MAKIQIHKGCEELDIFCASGEGPDVGINISQGGKITRIIDLTIKEAEEISMLLMLAARDAKEFDESYEEYCRKETEPQHLEI